MGTSRAISISHWPNGWSEWKGKAVAGRGKDVEIDTSGSRDFDKGWQKNNKPVTSEDTTTPDDPPKITGKP